ncbi:MAG: hypothetical protein MAG451_00068 [Anaerolineales bacterium]|nr:hypothetical protein [Anaerolineales bacterium]
MSFQGVKRLSAQSLGADDRVAEAVRHGRPAVFKVVNPDIGWVQKLHDASPDTVLIGRIVDDTLADKLSVAEGRAFAERILQKAGELGGIIRWWEGSNEAAKGPVAIRRLCEFERAFAERVQAEGYHALVGGFSTGVPQIVGRDSEVPWMGEWELFYPAMKVAHGVHFREYWHPHQLDDTWNAYRFEKWWPALPAWARAKWWLVGELGVDGGLAGEKHCGWMHYGMPADRYLDLLTGYARTMVQYPRLAAAIYVAGSGGFDEWRTFDIAGDVLDRISAEWATASAEPWGTPVEAEVVEDEVTEEEVTVTPQPLVAPQANNLIDKLAAREGTEGYTGRRSLDDVDIFVVHWLGAKGRNLQPDTVWREQTTHEDPDRPKFPGGAYHFQITQDGELTQLHPLTTVTWQSAGTDEVTGKHLNVVSIAVVIEPEREGDLPAATAPQAGEYRYTEGQISSCLGLYDWLSRRLGRALRVAGHYEVRPLTPEGFPSTDCPGPAWPIQLKPVLLDRDPDAPPLPAWEEATRVAWQSLIVSHNPDFAFPEKALQVLGPAAFALSDEARFDVGGTTWVRQLWSDGVEVKMLLTIEGQWGMDDIRVVPAPPITRGLPPRHLPAPRGLE